jgi:hypothetical protein
VYTATINEIVRRRSRSGFGVKSLPGRCFLKVKVTLILDRCLELQAIVRALQKLRYRVNDKFKECISVQKIASNTQYKYLQRPGL